MDRPVTSGTPLPERLPPLREELQLHPGAPHADGSPSWVIQDPVSNAFYRIGWLEFELLSRWALASPAEILAATTRDTLLRPTAEELAALYAFLLQCQLLTIHDPRYQHELVTRLRNGRSQRLRRLLHHYLFFRVPLLNPDRALQAALPWLDWLFARSTALLVGGLSLLGLILTARQSDVFVASFLDTLSPGGLAAYLVALAVTKSLHELGHALTATRYGLRVAHMGVAFVVLWPMLYTDTGESWRLSDNRQRLRIAAAGIATEMAIAGLATLAWHLTADGDLKQAFFFLATTAWVLTLALNISPFMRFDGYFILSDALDMPNLHERSFAVARAALRNTLLGWQEPDPEPLGQRQRQWMIAFAIATWIYRLSLFIGIAIAVYLLFFKLLGILLFVVEIAWFIVLPVWRELRVWHERRAEIAAYRRRRALAAGVVLLLVAALPWGYQVKGSGFVHPERSHTFYSPLPARLLERPPAGGPVTAGQSLFTLEQPELAYRRQVAEASAAAMDSQLRGLAALPDGEERRQAMDSRWRMHAAEALAQSAEAERLVLSAPFAGILTDVEAEAAPGTWIGTRQPLATLVDPQRWQAELLVRQEDVQRIERDARVLFYPNGQRLAPLAGRVVDIERTRTTALPSFLLSSQYGGSIAVLPDGRGLTPRDTLYRVRVALTEAPSELRILRGDAIIEGRPESWLAGILKSVLIVFIRELSF